MWSPHQVTLVRQIQSIQDKFIRLFGCRLGLAYRDVPLRLIEEELGFWKPEGVSRSSELFGRRHVGSNYEANSTLIRIQRLGNIVSPHVDFFADSVTVVKKKIVNALVL
ncbi:hypothetical protein J6590_084913 [Homalodisca vitripennis]|nr:hypothetical protein J6590_084913 [Homalodisca vitripennis]